MSSILKEAPVSFTVLVNLTKCACVICLDVNLLHAFSEDCPYFEWKEKDILLLPENFKCIMT